MNRRKESSQRHGPPTSAEHFDECPWCAQEMAEDRELVEVIQRSLWSSLAHENPPPEVWDRILARLPERRQEQAGRRMAWAWPPALSNAVAVVLLLVLVGVSVWQPFGLMQRPIPVPTTVTAWVDSRAGWRSVDQSAPPLPAEEGESLVEPAPASQLPDGAFAAMSNEGLLNLGYLHHMHRPSEGLLGGPKSGTTVNSEVSRNPPP